jgi:LPXTG-motif cell wall-anchored protein
LENGNMIATVIPLAAAQPMASSFNGSSVLVSASVAGLALLALGAWMLWRKKSKKVVTWMFFIAGFFLSGGLTDALTSMFDQAGDVGAHFFGVGVGVFMSIIGVILCLELWHSAHPKKGRGDVKSYHPYMALATPMLIIAGGGGVLYQAFVGISAALGHVAGPFSALFGG